MKKIALVNHKGGVGKTTSAVNIAAAMAVLGKKVLLVDTDPQMNATEALGFFDIEKSIYDSFSNNEPLPVLIYNKNLHVVPSSLDFAGIEIEIATRLAREQVLQGLLEPLEGDYDFCIIDCPPSLGLITLNVLVGANEVYIPMTAEPFAFTGIDSIVGVIEQIKKFYNPTLDIKGVFFTKYNALRVLSREIKKQLSESIGMELMEENIRMSVALSEGQSVGKDIFTYDAQSNGAKDYKVLVNEILKR